MKHFSCKEFEIDQLIKLKKLKKIRVGIALPVLNEAGTLKCVLQTLQKYEKLFDELIVIDSGSTDGSQKICEHLGITCIPDKKASRDLRIIYQRGKGWNLWASLYYLTTDIIIWIDSDIKNFDIRFVTGLLGPMLSQPNISFVKGYYHRPKGDARVTEIMARPFSNFIFPEVKNFIQPLSGEYGGRRKFLEQIYFYAGYSVEMAVLVQATHLLRPERIAQVYLDTRVHELQSVSALGKMSSGILYTLMTMANKYKIVTFKKKLPKRVRFFTSPDGMHFIPQEIMVAEKCLPRMITIKNYQKKFNHLKDQNLITLEGKKL